MVLLEELMSRDKIFRLTSAPSAYSWPSRFADVYAKDSIANIRRTFGYRNTSKSRSSKISIFRIIYATFIG